MIYRLRIHLWRVLWATICLAAVIVPVVALLHVRTGPSSGLVLNLSLTVGLLATSVLACAIVLASKVRSLTAALGIEELLHSHRLFGLLALFLTLGHVGFVIVGDPKNLNLLNPLTAPNRALAATAATVALSLLCFTSVARRRLRLSYEAWRAAHISLTIIVVGGAGLHVLLLNHLIKDSWMRLIFISLAALVTVLMFDRWFVRPLIALRHSYIVDDVHPESATVTTVTLRPSKRRSAGLRFQPGQFAWLRLDSPMALRESHPFTIASGAHRPTRPEFTVHGGGDFSSTVARLRPGRRVYLDGPHGSFSAQPGSNSKLLLIAGGVGITPMMSMLRTHAHLGDQREHCLVLGARSQEEVIFRTELAQLRRLLRLEVVITLSEPRDGWPGFTGRIDADLLAQVIPSRRERKNVEAYVCGPPAMVRGVVNSLDNLGIAGRHVHTEQFGDDKPTSKTALMIGAFTRASVALGAVTAVAVAIPMTFQL